MDTRTFNSIIPRYNERLAAEVLGMHINEHKDPDLLGNYLLLIIFRIHCCINWSYMTDGKQIFIY